MIDSNLSYDRLHGLADLSGGEELNHGANSSSDKFEQKLARNRESARNSRKRKKQ